MTAVRSADTAGLGRGWLTRWLPVIGHAPSTPPAVEVLPVGARTTPGRFLREVLFSTKRLTVPAAAMSVLHQVGEALVPVIAGFAVDQALAGGDPARLVFWLGVLAVDFLALSLAYRFAAQLTARATEQAQHRLRVTLSRHVLHPAARASTSRPDGGLVSTMTNDVARICAMGLVVFPVGELTGVVFIAASLLLIHWPLGVVVLIGAPIVVWLMGALSGRYARASREYQTLLADTVAQATDLVSGYRVIRGIRAEAEATRRYQTASRQTLEGAYLSAGVLGRFLAGSDTVSAVFIAGVAALAGWFALTGQLSIGGLIAAVGLTQALLPPMQMLTGNAIPLAAAAHASSGRVLDILHTSGVVATEPGGPSAPDRLAANGSEAASGIPVVALAVPAGGGRVRRVRVEAGELVGVRADDRTAALVTSALLHPASATDAEVTIGGVPAGRIANDVYRSRVTVAPHHGALFTGSIAENLHLPSSPPEILDAALHAAACGDFLATAGGMHAHVGEGGARLSGGQRQRLALARALASDAPVLVLHDPTTAIDAMTEARIASRLRGIRQGRSTLLLTTSPTLLSVCDRVIDLRDEEGGS